MMKTMITNWQLLTMLKIYTSSTGRLRYVSMSMTAFFLLNAKVKFIFFYEKFGDLYVQNMSCVPPDYMRRQFEIKENMR